FLRTVKFHPPSSCPSSRSRISRHSAPLSCARVVIQAKSSICFAEARNAGPDLPYVEVWPLYEVFASMLHPWKLGASMFVGFGLLALTISGVGLAGTIAYSVQRRRRELGIRKALGAQGTDLLATVLRRTAAVVFVGLTVGVAGALAAGSSLKALLFGIEPTEWRVYVVAAILMMMIAALASMVPARRASTVDPTELLRSE